MLTKVIETMIDEFKKEENKKVVDEFIDPYVSSFNFYSRSIIFLQIFILIAVVFCVFTISFKHQEKIFETIV